jgi:hypothetical protein
MGLDHPAANDLAVMEANRRAEVAASRHRAPRRNVAPRRAVAWRARPGLSHH